MTNNKERFLYLNYCLCIFFGILTVILLLLKAAEIIDWAWWIILLPIFGPIAVLTITTIIFFVFIFAIACFETKEFKKTFKKGGR